MSRSTLILFSLIILAVCYYFLDRPLSYWAASLPPQFITYSRLFAWAFDPNVFKTAWPLIFFVYTFILEKKAFRNELLFILLAIPLAILAIDILKVLVGRARPELLLTQGLYGFFPLGKVNAFHSFPSGHAVTIGALMAALSCFFPKRAWLLFLLGLVLSFVRILSLDHYLSDIWAGNVLAFIIVRILYPFYQRRMPWKTTTLKTKS